MKALRLITICSLLLPSLLSAQQKEKQIGVSAQVFYSHRIWTQSESEIDSLNSVDKGTFGINPQLWYYHYKDRFTTYQIGLHYSTYGFSRRSKDLEFGDKVHPDLPRITTNVIADPAYFEFYYRFHRIQVPLMLNRQILAFKRSISLKYYFTPGISLGYLIYDKTVARSRGFGYDSKNRFVVNNVLNSNPFNATLIIGGRIEYRISAKYRSHFQPVIRIPLTSEVRGGEKAFMPVFGVNFGLSVLTNKIDEKE